MAAPSEHPSATGPIVWLWVTSICLAHAFAFYWLGRALLLQYPGLAAALSRCSWRRWRRGTAEPGDDASVGHRSNGPESSVVSITPPDHAQRGLTGAAWHMTWKGLGFSAPTTGGSSKQLLIGIWGHVASQQVLGILGPSGAGKSTLLDLLSLRRMACTGSNDHQLGVFLNDQPATSESMKAVSSFIPQDDVLLPQMTVRETLQLHAALRIPRHTDQDVRRRADRQETVLTAMGLSKRRDMLVGGVLPGGILLRGLSGGERKRLAIATGLLPNPSLLFVDEPTSGLDAFAALSTMSHLATMAHGPGPEAGCAVVATLHQPRSAIWELLDLVTILARGHMVYHGPTCQLQPWLTQQLPPLLGCKSDMLPFCYIPAAHGTLADWALDVVCLTDQLLLQTVCMAEANAQAALIVSRSNSQVNSPGRMSGLVKAFEHAGGNSNNRGLGNALISQVSNHKEQALQQHTSETGQTAAASVCQANSTPSLATLLHQAACQDKANIKANDVEEGVSYSSATYYWISAAASHFLSHYKNIHADSGNVTLQNSQLSNRAQATSIQTTDVCPDANTSDSCAAKSRRKVSGMLASIRMAFDTYRVLAWREAIAAMRNPADVAGRMLTFTYVAAIGNFLLYGGGQEGDHAGSIRIRVSWLYFALFFYMVMPFLFMSVFTADKRFYLADVKAGLYKPGTHYMAKLTASLPLNVLISLAFILTAYGMFGYRHTALAVVQVSAVSALFSLVCLQWIFFATAVSPNQDIAFMMAVAFAVFNLLVNGLFIGPDSQGSSLSGIKYLKYISAMDWAWQGVLVAEFKGRTFHCGHSGAQAYGLDALGLFPELLPSTAKFDIIRNGLAAQTAEDCVADGDAVLKFFGTVSSVGICAAALLVYLAVLHTATYLALWGATRKATSAKAGSMTAG